MGVSPFTLQATRPCEERIAALQRKTSKREKCQMLSLLDISLSAPLVIGKEGKATRIASTTNYQKAGNVRAHPAEDLYTISLALPIMRSCRQQDLAVGSQSARA